MVENAMSESDSPIPWDEYYRDGRERDYKGSYIGEGVWNEQAREEISKE